MKQDLEKVKLLARDLRDGKEWPRSPRALLAGYVLAARAVDKCRAVLVGWGGEFHSNCPVDQIWLKFTEIDYNAFKSFLATGATDDIQKVVTSVEEANLSLQYMMAIRSKLLDVYSEVSRLQV